MTVAITIQLFQAVYTDHGYLGRFWEIGTYISVMTWSMVITFIYTKIKLTPS